MSVYIGLRDLASFYASLNMCGGTFENLDSRLTTVKDDIYLLTFAGQDYAVSKERAEQFIAEVISKSTGSHPGSFPMKPALSGSGTVAVVEIPDGDEKKHYDFDADLLSQMLTALKDECGSPLDKRGLINYCYPNPSLPEDFDLKTIYHQIYCGPDNTPTSVVRTVFPDTETSHFWILDDKAHVVIREGNNENKYNVPDDLIPEIKDKVRELCKEPAEAYVDPGNWESYITFGKTKERIFTDPDRTLELLKYIASKSVFDSTEQIDKNKYYSFNPNPNLGFGMMGFMNGFPMNQTASPAPQAAPQPAAVSDPDSWDCIMCGGKGNRGKFCTECGSPRPTNG